MVETVDSASASPSPRRRRKWRWVFLSLVVLAAATLTSIYFYNRYQAESALKGAIAETDEQEPEWRLEQIEARRDVLAPEQNAAVPIKAASELVPGSWSAKTMSDKLNQNPRVQLDVSEVAELREALEPHLAAVEMAAQAVGMPSGCYPVPLTLDSPRDTHAVDVLNLGRYLHDLAILQCQEGRRGDAWKTAFSLLAAARSFGEEPVLVSQLTRASLQAQAATVMEMCLAQGNVDEPLLATAQQELADEAAQPLFYYALRGERAGMHIMLTGLEAGTVDPQVVFKDFPGGMTNFRFRLLTAGGSFKKDHAWMLRFYNKALEHAKLSPAEMRTKMRELDKKTKAEAPPLTKAFTIELAPNWCDTFVQTNAQLECAVAGIAVERFRLQKDKNRWPHSLQELVDAKLLTRVPTDPFDGRPMRYRPSPDGSIVYSTGPTAKYTGNALDVARQNQGQPVSQRFEFRLWNVNQRPQMAKEKGKVNVNVDKK